jgi:hypothetical protein
MISVVVCSVNRNLALQIKRNIDETIGVEYELIIIDNNTANKGITQVYNDGASRAKFEIICFVHEDVLFRTHDWGKKIAGYYDQHPQLSLIGVAGSRYKSRTLSGWSTGLRQFDCSNVLHINASGGEQKLYANPFSSPDIEFTVTLDGVFICARKQSWKQISFDNNLKGFHLYDIDFSCRHAQVSKVAVTFEIDLVHLTEGGNFGDAWVNNTIEWHSAFKQQLPLSAESSLPHNTASIERILKKKWLHRLKTENISFANRMRWIKETRALSNPTLWPHIAVFFGWRSIKKMFR